MYEVPSFNNGGRIREVGGRGGMRPKGWGARSVFMATTHTTSQNPNIHYIDTCHPPPPPRTPRRRMYLIHLTG